MASGRNALIVATDDYQDANLRKLRAPARDAKELERVLGDPAIGDFDVEVSRNEPEHLVRRKIAKFFADRRRDDVLLLHIACHGLKDDFGRLYFAAADTEIGHLDSTAVWAEFVNRQMTNSRSRRIILFLDCCYSGAFAGGMTPRAGESVEVRERFEGSGRVVLTASSSMEYSFEGDDLTGDPQPSVFTTAVVSGLETGEADRDRDSWVSVDELYEYVHEQVQARTPKQTPGKWSFDVRGDLYVARSPHKPVKTSAGEAAPSLREARQLKEPPEPARQTFKQIWYRPEDPGAGTFLKAKAMTDRGTITLERGRLSFEGKWTSFDITDIRRISLERRGADRVNAWVVIEYGKEQIAQFADGRLIGWSGLLGGTRKLRDAIQHFMSG